MIMSIEKKTITRVLLTRLAIKSLRVIKKRPVSYFSMLIDYHLKTLE